ncbi:MAG: sodium:solute symporter family protein [Planctomycetia bacterium]|nr:sodium:solute symporter family protein [Planctomycetia bacterium]
MQGVFWGGVATVGAMFAVFLAIGWLAARKVRHKAPAELMLAGRTMPLWIAVLTTTATWVDGGYLLGTVENTQRSLASGLQGGVCFGLSLVLGGLFFAGRMRRLEFTTLIDPFEARFGRTWAAVLAVPAMLGELFWSAELLVAIGATCGVILNIDLSTAIIASAAVVTCYTFIGGMWSVAYTDVFQLALVPIGMLAALPFALAQTGGLAATWDHYSSALGSLAAPLPPLGGDSQWPLASRVVWWDLTAMLILGGIPWNCYFQRVLSCQTVAKARWHSVIAGFLTIALTVPPVILGIAAFAYTGWDDSQRIVLDNNPAMALPMLLRQTAPYAVAMLGLGAIVGAVTSSFSASILSAGSMFSWNIFHRLFMPRGTSSELQRMIRGSIVALGVAATAMALAVRSVADLWFFTADLVFVLLFPQLVMAMFDPKANRTGSMAAFAVSLVLRLAGGIAIMGLPAMVDYGAIVSRLAGQDAGRWLHPATGESVFPVRVLAAVAGLVVLPVVSRLSSGWDPPRVLGRVDG